MEDVIRLDRKSFEALAAQSRVKILKSLSVRRKTLSELAKELGLSVSTMKEHLDVLANAGLIIQRDEGRKWKYYDLTRKGSGIVAPRELKVLIMLGISLLLVLGSGWNFINVYSPAQMGQAYGMGMQENGGAVDADLDSFGLEMESGERNLGDATESAPQAPLMQEGSFDEGVVGPSEEGEVLEGGMVSSSEEGEGLGEGMVGSSEYEEEYSEGQSAKAGSEMPGEGLEANEGAGVVLASGFEKEFPYAEAAFFGASLILMFALSAYFWRKERIQP
jgi:DNA-binding transcriptional ArsR family regulator